MKKLIILTAIIALCLCSCAKNTTTELTAEQKAIIIAEVENQYAEAISNLSKLDINIWSEPWSENEFISVNSGVNHFSSLREFKDSVTYWFTLRERQNVEIVETSAKILNPELILLTSIANWNILFKSEEQIQSKALATLLWKKGTNGWKIIFLHESWKDIEETSGN